MRSRSWFVLLFLALVLPLGAQRVVVPYVSLDEEHSRKILDLFEKRTGIKVKAVFDTEDNKTVGLVNRLIAERENPRCDVYWNNECGQTVRLQKEGLLQTYPPKSAATIPAQFKDPEGYWTGFGARARVLIYNTEMIKPEELPRRLEDLAKPEFASRLLMAKPLTGTTLTHVAALYATWGQEKTERWLDDLQQNGVRWEKGNAQVMREVGGGTRPFGLTDTDDANVSVKLDKKPTATIFLDQGEGELGNLVIPNSVMIMNGAPNLAEAKELVEFLCSPEVEKLLSEGNSAQIPLHPEVEAAEGVVPLTGIKPMPADFGQIGDQITQRIESLSARFNAPPSSGGLSLMIAMVALLLGIVLIGLLLRRGS